MLRVKLVVYEPRPKVPRILTRKSYGLFACFFQIADLLVVVYLLAPLRGLLGSDNPHDLCAAVFTPAAPANQAKGPKPNASAASSTRWYRFESHASLHNQIKLALTIRELLLKLAVLRTEEDIVESSVF